MYNLLFTLSEQGYGHLFHSQTTIWSVVTNCTPEHYFSHTHLERGHREGLLTSASPCSSCSLCHLRLSAWCRLRSAISSGPISKVYMKNCITNFYTAYMKSVMIYTVHCGRGLTEPLWLYVARDSVDSINFRDQIPACENFFLQKFYADDKLRKLSTLPRASLVPSAL